METDGREDSRKQTAVEFAGFLGTVESEPNSQEKFPFGRIGEPHPVDVHSALQKKGDDQTY